MAVCFGLHLAFGLSQDELPQRTDLSDRPFEERQSARREGAPAREKNLPGDDVEGQAEGRWQRAT